MKNKKMKRGNRNLFLFVVGVFVLMGFVWIF
jgi:hypothetical protein